MDVGGDLQRSCSPTPCQSRPKADLNQVAQGLSSSVLNISKDKEPPTLLDTCSRVWPLAFIVRNPFLYTTVEFTMFWFVFFGSQAITMRFQKASVSIFPLSSDYLVIKSSKISAKRCLFPRLNRPSFFSLSAYILCSSPDHLSAFSLDLLLYVNSGDTTCSLTSAHETVRMDQFPGPAVYSLTNQAQDAAGPLCCKGILLIHWISPPWSPGLFLQNQSR